MRCPVYSTRTGQPIEEKAEKINPYLVDAEDSVAINRSKPINTKHPMWFGNMPMDGGHLLLNQDERDTLISLYPQLEVWIKQLVGAREFLNNIPRYCLWLADASTRQLAELVKLPEIKERIDGVKQMRLSSSDAGTRKQAETPWKFRDTRLADTYILVPSVSSERRPYVPMGFFSKDTISTNLNLIIPDADLFEFGVLTSQMHMDWMRTVSGRLKSDYRYSAKLVYNNFPWPNVTDKQKQQIEKLAQAVLDARQTELDKDPETSLADLYDPDLMPVALRKAHTKLDKAVDTLYQPKGFKSPMERVQHLFNLYAEAISKA
ncbi:type IIL restriction-modification enzyme MmeI [Oceanospirillum maris]|uniref:type IIL restriction-modification enzyme MmeI n=1 Tax=Oceanospirillum maris TaxID=64977 RepID=UPI00040D4BFB|nr:type IIL restriction-modification enzyme MmeI [Oceanospirillum maris]